MCTNESFVITINEHFCFNEIVFGVNEFSIRKFDSYIFTFTRNQIKNRLDRNRFFSSLHRVDNKPTIFGNFGSSVDIREITCDFADFDKREISSIVEGLKFVKKKKKKRKERKTRCTDKI